MWRLPTLLALVVATGSAFAPYAAIGSMTEANDARSEANNVDDLVTVLVAKRNLVRGTVITLPEKLFVAKKVTRAAAGKGAFRRFDETIHKKLRKPIADGEVFTLDFVHDYDSLQKELQKESMRPGQIAFAVPIQVDPTCGWCRQLIEVDLILVVRMANGETRTSTILRKVLMLGTDSKAGIDDGRLVEKAVFAVYPGQDDQLSEALTEGTLSVRLSRIDE